MGRHRCDLILKSTGSRRAVVLLDWPSSRVVNVVGAFESFSPPVERAFLARFDRWVAGHIMRSKHYHAFSPQMQEGVKIRCCVFKNVPSQDRLYGFLHHPKRDDRSFEACVLVMHHKKKEDATDPAVLAQICAISGRSEIEAALEKQFR